MSIDSIGSYNYQKWGARCDVIVYAMEVTEMIDEKLWEEKHRGREWFTPEKAAEKLFQVALKPMVLELKQLLKH